MEGGLGMGSKMSPVLAELIMKDWEGEDIENKERIIYMDNSIGIWRGEEDELKEEINQMEVKKKDIQFELEVEK